MAITEVRSETDVKTVQANFAELDARNDGITATEAELNYLDIATLGTGAASKAVVLDTGEDYVWPATGILTYGVLKDPAGTAITATAAEINALDGAVGHMVGVYTPATGTCAVDFQLYDLAGNAIAENRCGFGYISDDNGNMGTAITSVATLSKGTITTLVTGSLFFWCCDTDGHIDMTLTGTAGDKYVTIVWPNGGRMRSEACTISE